MDYSPSSDYHQGRRREHSVQVRRQEARTEIARELRCIDLLLPVGDESAKRGIADALRRLEAQDPTHFTAAQRKQLASYLAHD